MRVLEMEFEFFIRIIMFLVVELFFWLEVVLIFYLKCNIKIEIWIVIIFEVLVVF